jgi:hypothetical protein
MGRLVVTSSSPTGVDISIESIRGEADESQPVPRNVLTASESDLEQPGSGLWRVMHASWYYAPARCTRVAG